MFTDARSLPSDHTLEADVAIIGAGPAGITLASELGDTHARIVLLESGAVDGSGSQSLGRGESVGQRYYRLERARHRGFGGSSHLWISEYGGLRSRPLDALDMEARPEIGRIGWPFGRSALHEHYLRAQYLCGLGPFDYDVATWERPGHQRLGLPDDEVRTAIFQFGPVDRFRQRFDELKCHPSIHVLANGTAVELVPDDAGSAVTAVRIATGDGRHVELSARQVALAGGGIENPRLLLLSRRAHPRGMGNGHDLVGRFFMEHPHARTGVIRPAGDRLEETVALYSPHVTDGATVMGKLVLPEPVLRREELLTSAWFVRPTTEALASDVGRALVDLREAALDHRVPPPPGTGERLRTVAGRPGAAVRTLARRRGRPGAGQRSLLELTVMSEQEPDPASRVTLGEGRDELGQPVARLDWRLSDLYRHSVRRTQEVFDAALRRSGIGSLESFYGDEHPPVTVGGGFHHMGTTRMHTDPRRGVVDADCRVHGMANLFVAGSCVFPSSGYGNPTLTVVALAARLADHLQHLLTGLS